jgi:NAD(P)-dependent dehydrogenase (short-subunit alcohol dehydrogenase family)
MEKWTAAEIPEQAGRTALVTGASSGLGLIVAMKLARASASVVLACRSLVRGAEAAEQIRLAAPGAAVEVAELDRASLRSVRAFAERYRSEYDSLDLLINNGGLMAPPRGETADGFELQFGTIISGTLP